MQQASPTPIAKRELVLERVINIPAEKLYRAWTEADLLKQWFTPKPWTVASAEIDVRPGGTSLIVMRSPDGDEFPNRGIYLEVIKNKKLVFTDAYIDAWTPSEKPFITATVSFDSFGNQTKYMARVQHWTVADCEAHERMGFHEGWAIATDQLTELAAGL